MKSDSDEETASEIDVTDNANSEIDITDNTNSEIHVTDNTNSTSSDNVRTELDINLCHSSR